MWPHTCTINRTYNIVNIVIRYNNTCTSKIAAKLIFSSNIIGIYIKKELATIKKIHVRTRVTHT